MTTSSQHPTYPHLLHQAKVDGGYSGELTISVARGGADEAGPLVFVDSDVLGPRRLMLAPQEAIRTAEAFLASAAEVIPPYPWDIAAFQSVFGFAPPAQHAATLADLNRYARKLSDDNGDGVAANQGRGAS